MNTVCRVRNSTTKKCQQVFFRFGVTHAQSHNKRVRAAHSGCHSPPCMFVSAESQKTTYKEKAVCCGTTGPPLFLFVVLVPSAASFLPSLLACFLVSACRRKGARQAERLVVATRSNASGRVGSARGTKSRKSRQAPRKHKESSRGDACEEIPATGSPHRVGRRGSRR
jgi:hypothetical protein